MLNRSAFLVASLAGVAALSASCSSGSDGAAARNELHRVPTAPSSLQPESEGLRVTRVRVFLREGAPQAYVEGELGDGCTYLLPVEQQRVGNVVDVRLRAERRGEVCIMILRLLREWVPLQGTFGPGTYTVRANGVSTNFRLVAGPAGGLEIEPNPGPLPEQ